VRAREDLRNARDWYEEQQLGLGSRFGDEIAAVIEKIEQNPSLYAKIHNDVRRAMTRHFPYAIYFIIAEKRISVLRVLHQARDPRKWPRAR
jgi:plasmid stabilization system protein ParE